MLIPIRPHAFLSHSDSELAHHYCAKCSQKLPLINKAVTDCCLNNGANSGSSTKRLSNDTENKTKFLQTSEEYIKSENSFFFLNPNDPYLQHLFIFSSKQWNGAKDQLEQLEIQIGEFHIRAHFWQSVQKILYQNRCKEGRGSRICQEGVGNYL